LLSFGDGEFKIESGSDWGYSPSGVDVIHGRQTQAIAFDYVAGGIPTPRPTNTPRPTSTPTITLTPDPSPTSDCAAGWSRLFIGGYASVTGDADAPPNRVRSAPSASAEIIALIYPQHIVLILEGPVCADGVVFWKVQSDAIPGGEGWTAEGDGTVYWLEPVVP
jgi:hypothetical protein